MLLALAGGLWAVTRIEVTVSPSETVDAEPSETPAPEPLRVIVDPPRISATDKVRVTALCRTPGLSATVVSAAFAEAAASIGPRRPGVCTATSSCIAGLPPASIQ